MNKTYAGTIKNQGTQKVDALFKNAAAAKSDVLRGEDLRSGKKDTKGAKK